MILIYEQRSNCEADTNSLKGASGGGQGKELVLWSILGANWKLQQYNWFTNYHLAQMNDRTKLFTAAELKPTTQDVSQPSNDPINLWEKNSC